MDFKLFRKLLFLVLFLISLIASINLNSNKINLPFLNGLYKSVEVDVIFEKEAPQVFFDNKKINTFLKIDNNHYLFYDYGYKKIKNIHLEKEKNIKKLIVYNDRDIITFNKIQNNISINNNKTLLEKITIICLSFFYNYSFYIIAYIFLFLFIINLNKNFISKHKFSFYLILILGIIFRLSSINNIPFWDDEIYVLVHTSNQAKLIELFQDPGNPPLYFILFKLWRSIVKNEEYYKILPLITGVLFNITFYHYIKHYLKEKKALIGFLAVNISIVLIYFSQEIRCYMLLMLLCLINSIYLFKFNNKKNKIIYLINTILILNTHFYGTFFVLWQFFYGMKLFFNKKKKLKDFIIINCAAFISFCPILIYKKSSLVSSFNSWIQAPKFGDFIQLLTDFSIYLWIIVLFLGLVIFLYLKTKTKKDKIFIFYNFFAIIFVIISSIIFSYTIKPIFMYRYFYVIYPNFLALCVYVITYDYKNKLKFFIQLFLFISLITTARVNSQNLFNNSQLYKKFIISDIQPNKRNYIIYTNTVKGYNEFTKPFKNKAEIIYAPVDKGIDMFILNEYKIKKPSVCYILNLYLEKNIFKYAKNIELYKTPLGIITKFELN